jgi:hypothetical protein
MIVNIAYMLSYIASCLGFFLSKVLAYYHMPSSYTEGIMCYEHVSYNRGEIHNLNTEDIHHTIIVLKIEVFCDARTLQLSTTTL